MKSPRGLVARSRIARGAKTIGILLTRGEQEGRESGWCFYYRYCRRVSFSDFVTATKSLLWLSTSLLVALQLQVRWVRGWISIVHISVGPPSEKGSCCHLRYVRPWVDLSGRSSLLSTYRSSDDAGLLERLSPPRSQPGRLVCASRSHFSKENPTYKLQSRWRLGLPVRISSGCGSPLPAAACCAVGSRV